MDYILEEDDMLVLRAISDRLHGGTMKERDEGHRLWLVLERLQPMAAEPAGQPHAKA